MLKLIKTTAAIATCSLCMSAPAQANVSEALQNICTIVKADDKRELRKKMKRVQSDYRLKLQDYYSGISCGGESLIRTAMLNDAVNAGSLMIKKMPRKHLSAPESDGKTLKDWATENGLSDSPITSALNARI